MSFAAFSFSRRETIAFTFFSCSAESFRQMDVLERMDESPARKLAHFDFAIQFSIAFKFADDRASNAGRPPMDSDHFKPSIASSTQSIDGVLIVSPSKMPAISLPPFVIWKILGRGRSGV